MEARFEDEDTNFGPWGGGGGEGGGVSIGLMNCSGIATCDGFLEREGVNIDIRIRLNKPTC